MKQDSDMGNGKLGNESYSGNDDASDDNQQESGNNDDLNVSDYFITCIYHIINLTTFPTCHLPLTGKSRLVALKEIKERERSTHGTTR